MVEPSIDPRASSGNRSGHDRATAGKRPSDPCHLVPRSKGSEARGNYARNAIDANNPKRTVLGLLHRDDAQRGSYDRVENFG
jgi:hypothetical protein